MDFDLLRFPLRQLSVDHIHEYHLDLGRLIDTKHLKSRFQGVGLYIIGASHHRIIPISLFWTF
jgi:hypothetical protein